jgi:predicted nuclease of predicted toxin-antitoxin system
VRFLLNVNVPRDLGRRLGARGHECRHAADVGLARAPDSVIVDEARKAGETILTHDLDYGHLLAFSGRTSPSVIIVRTENTKPAYLEERFVSCWAGMERSLAEGAIVVIEDAALRIRPLGPVN